MDNLEKMYDFIVVGSGPGGAAVAKDLAKNGKKVLILERGPNQKLRGKWWQYVLHQCMPFKSLLFTTELLGMVRGLTTGGSSVFYYGTCFPVPFNMLESYGIDIRKEIDEIKKEVPITPLTDEMMGSKAKKIMESAKQLGYKWEKLDKFIFSEKFSPDQHMAGTYYGDPHGVKWSAREFIKDATDNGAVLLNHAFVKKIIIENETAKGVEFSRFGKKYRVSASKIIIAAGGIGSPVILRKSGIKEAGHNFFFDPLITVVGYIKDKETKEIPMSAGIQMQDEGYLMTDMAWPKFIDFGFTSAALRFNRSFSQKNALRIMIKARDTLGGRLSDKGGVRKKLSRHDREKLNKGYARAKEILENAGAKGIHKTWKLAAHPGGTVKLGELVDSNLETKYKNLFVCDCSVIPKAWGLPPTLTILGLGKKLAKHLSLEKTSQVKTEKKCMGEDQKIAAETVTPLK